MKKLYLLLTGHIVIMYISAGITGYAQGYKAKTLLRQELLVKKTNNGGN